MMHTISPRLRLEAAITLIGTVILIVLALLYFLMTVVRPLNEYGHRNVVRRVVNDTSSMYADGRFPP